MVISPAQILQKIEDGEFRLINLEQSHYYISKSGDVISLNLPQPRHISPTQRTTGEYCIALYVPDVKVFNLAELILTTFDREAKEGEFACFKNLNPQEIQLTNLYWGSASERNKWRSEISMSRSKKMVEITQEAPDELTQHVHNYYCNKAFFVDILGFVVQLNRLVIQNTLSDEDKSIALRCLQQLTEVTSVTVLNFHKLESIFEVEFCEGNVNKLFFEYRDVLVKNRNAYTNL